MVLKNYIISSLFIPLYRHFFIVEVRFWIFILLSFEHCAKYSCLSLLFFDNSPFTKMTLFSPGPFDHSLRFWNPCATILMMRDIHSAARRSLHFIVNHWQFLGNTDLQHSTDVTFPAFASPLRHCLHDDSPCKSLSCSFLHHH